MQQDRPQVIVVDDDVAVRDALDSLLRSVGLSVRLFGSVADLLDDGAQADCLVLDVRLPGVSGLDFQDHLARNGAAPPVVFMTGHGDIPMTGRAMKTGAVDFLAKPFRDQDMLDAVSTAIGRSRQMASEQAAMAGLRGRYQLLTPREREMMGRDGLTREAPISSHRTGQFSGEVNQLAGRSSDAAGRAGAQGCQALTFDAEPNAGWSRGLIQIHSRGFDVTGGGALPMGTCLAGGLCHRGCLRRIDQARGARGRRSRSRGGAEPHRSGTAGRTTPDRAPFGVAPPPPRGHGQALSLGRSENRNPQGRGPMPRRNP